MEYECWFTNEKMTLIITLDVLRSSLGKTSKINIMKSKLETEEPRFYDKIHFQRRTDHFEGSTASGRSQNELRYLFWIQNCQRIRICLHELEETILASF